MTRTKFIVGTRGSALARWQTDHVTSMVRAAHATQGRELDVEVRVITTQGDTSLAERLVGQIEKGFFTAELEAELRTGGIDWAVHSLKDLPTRLPDDLDVAAVLPRVRPSDLLLVRAEAFRDRGASVLPLVDGARVGTSSLRRDAQIKTFSPTSASQPLRGNVPTRVEKLRAGTYEAIVLAGAGVTRLGLNLDGFRVIELDPRRWQPAPGQGSIAVEARANDPEVGPVLRAIDDAASRAACSLERRFLRVLEGGCATPFGAHIDHTSSDARAHLGRAGDDGLWRTVTVALPAPVDAALDALVDDDFIHRALAALANASKESPHDDVHALWRPL